MYTFIYNAFNFMMHTILIILCYLYIFSFILMFITTIPTMDIMISIVICSSVY